MQITETRTAPFAPWQICSTLKSCESLPFQSIISPLYSYFLRPLDWLKAASSKDSWDFEPEKKEKKMEGFWTNSFIFFIKQQKSSPVIEKTCLTLIMYVTAVT